MFGKKISSLDYNEIQAILMPFIKDKDPSLYQLVLDSPSEGQEILMGSSYWTLLQAIDNFLVGKYDQDLYKRFKQMEKEAAAETDYQPILPSQPENTTNYNLKFLRFLLNMRPLEDKEINKIIEGAKIKLSNRQELMNDYDSFISFVADCVAQLQFYEGQIGLNPKDKPILIDNIKQNNELTKLYLSARPKIKKQLANSI